MALGFFDTLFAFGARFREKLSGLFFEASQELPDAVTLAKRWERRSASHEEMAYDLAKTLGVGPTTRTGRGRARSIDATFAGTPEMDWESFTDEQDSPRAYPTSGAETERHLLELLSRNPDFLGAIIQRERRRGNPLFL